ncbi:uncharacterized protein TNCV_3422471 [Trichonephila clavipes]|nr:uncharacterized protein TNCV_3422471 [Trichonephila clavipes]
MLCVQLEKVQKQGEMFCGVMNLPQPPTRFSPYGKRILNAAKLVYEDSIQNAAKEAICKKMKVTKNIAVAVYGTWQKRGYTSLNGVVTVTSIDTDGKCLSGKNRLTEHEIDNLQSYYGSAIRRNHSSVQNMRQAIWAIFCISYQLMNILNMVFVPSGRFMVWFLKAEASGKSYKHKNSLPVAVVEAMRPIF